MPTGEHSPGRVSTLRQKEVKLRTTQASSMARTSTCQVCQLIVIERSSNAQRPECNANDAVQVSVIRGWQEKDIDLVVERTEHTRRIVECQERTNKSAWQKRYTTDLTEGRQTQRCPGGASRKQNRRLGSAKTWLTGSKPRWELRLVDRECRRRDPPRLGESR